MLGKRIDSIGKDSETVNYRMQINKNFPKLEKIIYAKPVFDYLDKH